MKKFILWLTVALFLSVVVSTSIPQDTTGPYVLASMIEISYDGTLFVNATALVSEIQILEGQATGVHITHARRGMIITQEGQLGFPHESKKVTFLLNTSAIPTNENKFYMRYKFGVGLDESPYADPSEVVKLIGKPGKLVNKGVQK